MSQLLSRIKIITTIYLTRSDNNEWNTENIAIEQVKCTDVVI